MTAVHVVNYGLGNLGSIMNMFRRIGVSATLANTPQDLEGAEKILLPGVGAFDAGIKNLKERGFISILNRKVVQEKCPVMGICLGMQLMSNRSDEGKETGLSWIDSETVDMRPLMPADQNIKLPHIGWNYIHQKNDHALCKGLPLHPRFYFVHRYMVQCTNADQVLATTTYGGQDITAMIVQGNVAGAQFHPEKSHKFGMQLLRNFSAWNPLS